MANDENPRDLLDCGREERLAAFAKSNMFSTQNKIINETLRSWYPELSEKEMMICEWTFNTMSDIGLGNWATYIELIARLLEHENFANEEEIEDVIKSLVSKSVLEVREDERIFGGDEKSLKVLVFTQENLYEELQKASCENFKIFTDAYFCPRRKFD